MMSTAVATQWALISCSIPAMPGSAWDVNISGRQRFVEPRQMSIERLDLNQEFGVLANSSDVGLQFGADCASGQVPTGPLLDGQP